MAFFPLLFFQKSEGCFNQGEAMKLKNWKCRSTCFYTKGLSKSDLKTVTLSEDIKTVKEFQNSKSEVWDNLG